MRTTILLTVFVVLIAVEFTNAQWPRRRKPSSDAYKWSVDVDSGTLVTQKALSLQSREAVFLFTYGKQMKAMNLTGSSMLMEFTDPAGVMAVRFGSKRRGVCFLLAISETLAQVKTDISTRNATTITLDDTVAFNATADPLTEEEADLVKEQHPALKHFCYRAKMVETNSMNVGDEDPDTKTVTMLGFDSRVALMIRGGKKPEGSEEKPKRPRGPRRGPWFPRRRG